MKIAINALSAKIGGGVTYLRYLIPELALQGSEHKFCLFISRSHFDEIFNDIKLSDNIKIIKLNTDGPLLRIVSEHCFLPFYLVKERIDLLFCPANIMPLFVLCKKIVWIQNIFPFIKKYINKNLRDRLLDIFTMISALKADRIILSSKDSLDLVLETGVSRSKCRQCYLGVKPFSLPLVNKEKIILLVSNIYSHKNIKTLVRAFSLLKEEIRQEFRLIIVGKTVGIESEAELNALLCLRKKLYLDENVVFNTEVDGKELAHLYASSLIFVMPSLIESFSFPVFEAMSSGLPVIAANATCLPEVLDGAGLLFRPDSPVDLAEKLTRLIEDPGLAATLAIKGKERAALFTWAKTTALLLGYFKELEKEPRNT